MAELTEKKREKLPGRKTQKTGDSAALASVPVSAKAVICCASGRLLLLRQKDGQWDLPGGKIDRGERLVDGLTREIYEETRLKLGPRMLLNTARYQHGQGDRLIYSFLCVAEKKLKKKHIRLSHEHSGFVLVDFGKARRLRIRKHHRDAILTAERQWRKLRRAA